MISKKKKFIFVHIPKTAGNSIQLALRDFSEDEIQINPKQEEYNAKQKEIHRFGINSAVTGTPKHATISKIFNHWDVNQLGSWDSYLKFSCVRNPWDRLISMYFSPHKGRSKFDRNLFVEVIEKMARKSQLDFLTIADNIAVDSFIKFENLTADFTSVCQKLGIDTDLPCVNHSNRKSYQDYYDEETRALVYDLYREEIEYFDYSF